MSASNATRSELAIFLAASLMVPVMTGYDFFFPYVVPRNIFFRVVIEAAASLAVFSLAAGSLRLRIKRDPIFWSLCAFVFASCLSAAFSPSSNHSFFGDFERMGGVWAWLHLLAFYVLLTLLREEDWAPVLNAALAVGLFVALKGIVEHFRSDRIAGILTDAAPPTTSTLGNSGLLAAYLLFALGIAVYLAVVNRSALRALYATAAGVLLVALVFAENRSTVLGLLAGGIVASVVFARVSPKTRYRSIVPAVALGVSATVAALVVVIKQFPRSALVSGLPYVLTRLADAISGGDASRTMPWVSAWKGFLDRPLLGYGPENYNLAWGAHFDPRIYALATDVYDRAHNQFLEILVTTGVVGSAAFVALWVAIGWSLARAYLRGRISAVGLAVLCGLQIAYAVYLGFWFFDLNSTMLWILFAALIASRAGTQSAVPARANTPLTRRPNLPLVAAAIAAVFAGTLYTQAYAPLRASRALALIEAPRDSIPGTLEEIDVATSTRARQTAHTPIVVADYLADIAPHFADLREDPTTSRALDSAIQQAISSFRQEIHRDTLNDRLYTHEAALLMSAANLYASDVYLRQAMAALRRAIQLSPRRIQQRMLLASAYLGERDTITARGVLKEAMKVDPQLGEPRYRLAALELKAGAVDAALTLMQSSLELGYVGPPEPYLTLGKRLEFSGRAAQAAKLYTDYLEAKYTEAVWDPNANIDRFIPSADLAVAAHLPLLYVRARDSELALKTAVALSVFDPDQTDVVDGFMFDIVAKRRKTWLARTSLLPCSGLRGWVADSAAVDACAVFRRKL